MLPAVCLEGVVNASSLQLSQSGINPLVLNAPDCTTTKHACSTTDYYSAIYAGRAHLVSSLQLDIGQPHWFGSLMLSSGLATSRNSDENFINENCRC